MRGVRSLVAGLLGIAAAFLGACDGPAPTPPQEATRAAPPPPLSPPAPRPSNRPLPSTPEADPLDEADAVAASLVERGLAYLAEHQNPDGSFGGEESRNVRLAVSSIATLAFLADGNSEHRGRYHRETSRGVKFLLDCAQREGPDRGVFRADGDTGSRMHGQGFATLALSQAHGMFGVGRRFARSSTEVRDILSEAVALILASQSRAGGWGYHPRRTEEDEGSMTVCMIQALRGARNAGIAVAPGPVQDALEYIRRSQKEDGSIRYSLHGDLRSSFELTAAGATTLTAGGDNFSPALASARDYLWERRFDEFLSGSGSLSSFPYYGLFYAVQALHFDYDDVRARRLARCYPAIVSWFRAHFDADTGVYVHTEHPRHMEMEYGDVYRTAFATLTLQIRTGFLPIFQR
ncbi:MAG: hypothetical protein R3F20_08250 [Planctomycetota bacterium]